MAKLSTHSKNTAPSTAELADREFERIDANKVVIRDARLIRVDPFRLMRASERATNRTASSRGKSFATRLRRVAT